MNVYVPSIEFSAERLGFARYQRAGLTTFLPNLELTGLR
jgi:hypothetical protein